MLIFGAGDEPYTDGEVSHCICPGCQFDTRTDWHKVPGFKGWCAFCGDTEVDNDGDDMCSQCADEIALSDDVSDIYVNDTQATPQKLTQQEKEVILAVRGSWLMESATIIADDLKKRGLLTDSVGDDCSDVNYAHIVASIAISVTAAAAEGMLKIKSKADNAAQ